MDEKCGAILAAIKSAKRSILYDMDKKINDLKNTIISNHITKMPKENITNCKEDLGVALPLQTMEDFITFEEAVATCQEKKRALKEFYRILVCGETFLKSCVKKVMTATMSKAVEIRYSAFGRQSNRCGKLDFSKTQTYACLNDILMEKFGHTDEYKKFSTILSRWMTGAADREGGRKQRIRSAE
ncbi:PREDICTED: uncharacterized protein LOC106751597 [Dinoponera quadriceps]|uniref:Uncharacterized protein LOC106751597 n=1 Tax=Dinoponera quadriceps TaxID=609295 RepID=A0A6P3YDU1_DINQU|nr:PREDICTED: uncharacterized protein LOC106751597 [Dinoponera quadriceps]